MCSLSLTYRLVPLHLVCTKVLDRLVPKDLVARYHKAIGWNGLRQPGPLGFPALKREMEKKRGNQKITLVNRA